jgi:crotonobetainyl-CoA:carnitine CoA-transferase CaiB-like acyl-CoA transferase
MLTHEDQDPEEQSLFANPLAHFYKTKDNRWLFLSRNVRAAVEPDPYWTSVCQALGLGKIENDPRFESEKQRLKNADALTNTIAKAFAGKTLEEWKARLAEFAIRFAPVYKPIEIINDPQARANDFFQAFDHPVYGPIEFPAPPLQFTETPGTIRTPAPELGQHTDEILLELGYDLEKIGLLRKEKVI